MISLTIQKSLNTVVCDLLKLKSHASHSDIFLNHICESSVALVVAVGGNLAVFLRRKDRLKLSGDDLQVNGTFFF